MFKSKFLLPVTTALCVLAASASVAQNFSVAAGTAQPVAPMDVLRGAGGHSELKCTGSAGHMTCTSKYAWVCPKGWSACSAAPAGGTCCTQN